MQLYSFWLPKQGMAPHEYEDALAHTGTGAWPVRCAVADGASETSFADRWAQLLAEAYVAGELDGPDGLPVLQEAWWQAVQGRPLPWYAEEKLSHGAYAALVGLTVHPDRTWQALALGDCCLFQVREERLVHAFPIDRADGFSSRPFLLSSRRGWRVAQADLALARGEWQPGDRIYLMSDALAAWFLITAEQGRRPWDALDAAENDLIHLIDRLRAGRALRNDDLTLLRLEV